MVAFLDLPREVRDSILELVLLFENPVDPKASEYFEPLDDAGTATRFQTWLNKGVLYNPELKEPNASSLLQVNRQLHVETRDALNRLPHKGSGYFIDVIFFHEEHLQLHWTFVPVKTTNLDTVKVSVAIDGHLIRPEGAPGRRRTIWSGGDGSGPEIVWLWYDALIRFLRAGPVGKTKRRNEDDSVDRHFTIQHLVLDFVTPSDPSNLPEDTKENSKNWLWARRGYHGFGSNAFDEETAERYRNTVMRPEWLAEYLRRMFGVLLKLNRGAKSYGALLYERIGSVTFSVDGQVLEEMSLAEYLSDNIHAPHQYSMPEEPIKDFNDWKARVYLHRLEVGLPVVPFTKRALDDMGRESQPQPEEYKPGRRVEDFRWGY